jgi:hypothetical protein
VAALNRCTVLYARRLATPSVRSNRKRGRSTKIAAYVNPKEATGKTMAAATDAYHRRRILNVTALLTMVDDPRSRKDGQYAEAGNAAVGLME